jgi:hypothetical protein
MNNDIYININSGIVSTKNFNQTGSSWSGTVKSNLNVCNNDLIIEYLISNSNWSNPNIARYRDCLNRLYCVDYRLYYAGLVPNITPDNAYNDIYGLINTAYFRNLNNEIKKTINSYQNSLVSRSLNTNCIDNIERNNTFVNYQANKIPVDSTIYNDLCDIASLYQHYKKIYYKSCNIENIYSYISLYNDIFPGGEPDIKKTWLEIILSRQDKNGITINEAYTNLRNIMLTMGRYDVLNNKLLIYDNNIKYRESFDNIRRALVIPETIFFDLCNISELFNKYMKYINENNNKIIDFFDKFEIFIKSNEEDIINEQTKILLNKLTNLAVNKALNIPPINQVSDNLRIFLEKLQIFFPNFNFVGHEPIDIYKNILEEAISINNNIIEDKIKKYKMYTRFANYLNSYSNIPRDIVVIFREINNNNFPLDQYDFVNHKIKIDYLVIGNNYNSLLNLFNTNSIFLDKDKVFNSIWDFLSINVLLALFNNNNTLLKKLKDGDLNLAEFNQLKQILRDENYKFFLNIDHFDGRYLNINDKYQFFIELGSIFKSINDDIKKGKDRKMYYPKISKLFTTYNIIDGANPITDTNIYRLLNNINNTSDNIHKEELKRILRLLSFIYENDINTNKINFNKLLNSDNIDLINNLIEFTKDIDNDEYFKIYNMIDNINNKFYIKISKNMQIPKQNINIPQIFGKYREIQNVPAQRSLDNIPDINYNLKFITAYNLSKMSIIIAEDIEKIINLIIQYVNTFRNPAIPPPARNALVVEMEIRNDSLEFINNGILTPNFRAWIEYNKSLNNFVNFRAVDYNNRIIFLDKLELMNKNGYLNIDNMRTKIIDRYGNIRPTLDYLLTDRNIDKTDNDDKRQLAIINKDLCIADKIKNKELLSGIKIFIIIYNCSKKDKIDNNNNNIYLYLIKNTKEINNRLSIKQKKLNNILNNLENGTCDQNEIKIIKKVINNKKIIDINITEIILDIPPNNILPQERQKDLYYTLLYISPEDYKLDPYYLFQNYIKSKWDELKGTTVGTLSNTISSILHPFATLEKATNSSINIDFIDFYKYLNKLMTDKIGNYWMIYLYFNFDSKNITIEDLNKIFDNLNKGIFIQNKINTLRSIIQKNSIQLKKIGKEQNYKLRYFMTNKFHLILPGFEDGNKILFKQLYNILTECCKQNYLFLNGLELIKEKININTENDEKLISNLEIFSNDQLIIDYFTSLENGEADNNQIDYIIRYINNCDSYIKDNQQIKIFYNQYITNVVGNNYDLEYDSQYKLYYILEDILKTSTFLSEITQETITTTKDTITQYANDYATEKMITYFGSAPTNLNEQINTAIDIGKILLPVAGLSYAAYATKNAISNLIYPDSNKNLENTTKLIVTKNDFKKSENTLLIGLSAAYGVYNIVNLTKQLYNLVVMYINYHAGIIDAPLPDYNICGTIIQTLISSAISMFLINKKGGSRLPDDEQSNEIIKLKDENKTEGIFREMLNWLYNKISELLGLNNYTPINNKDLQITNNKKSFENIYTHLKENFEYDPDNIFKDIEKNEYPDQIKIIETLNNRYNNFMKLTSNQFINLTKKDKKKIKIIIADIVNLELNLFKGSKQYTFINALKTFLNK